MMGTTRLIEWIIACRPICIKWNGDQANARPICIEWNGDQDYAWIMHQDRSHGQTQDFHLSGGGGGGGHCP